MTTDLEPEVDAAEQAGQDVRDRQAASKRMLEEKLAAITEPAPALELPPTEPILVLGEPAT